MKWKNKGHEFDEAGIKFKNNPKLIFIGDNFDQTHYYIDEPVKEFLNFLKPEIEFIKIPQKYAKRKMLVKLILLLLEIKHNLKKQKAVIIAHYHYTKLKEISILSKYLKRFYPEKPVFDTNEFFEKYLSVYALYTGNKVYVRDTCIIATTVCTLNCKYCLNFTPFIKEPAPVPLEKLKEEADIYFKSVDKAGFFQISGGEPLSYKYLGDYIEWLAENYGKQIGQLLLATNGTLIPNEKLTKILKKYNVILLLDNYTAAVPRTKPIRDNLIKYLDENKIDYRNYADKQEFFRFFPANEDYSRWSDEELAERADKCWGLQPWRNLRNGRVYYCNFSSFAVTAGIIKDNPVNYFDLNNAENIDKKAFIEFLSGYSELGYDTFCRLCNGINSANTLTTDIAGRQASCKQDWHEGMTLQEYEEADR